MLHLRFPLNKGKGFITVSLKPFSRLKVMNIFKALRKFRRNRSGMVNIIIGAVMALVVGGVLLMVGVLVQAGVHDAIPAQTGETNTTIEGIHTAVLGGYDLMTVLPTVLAAGAIIAAIVGGFLVYRSRQ